MFVPAKFIPVVVSAAVPVLRQRDSAAVEGRNYVNSKKRRLLGKGKHQKCRYLNKGPIKYVFPTVAVYRASRRVERSIAAE